MDRIPGPTGGSLARLRAFHRDPLRFFQDLQAHYGPQVRFRMGPWTFFLLNDAESVGAVLSHHRPFFHKGPGLDAQNPLVGGGLLTSEEEAWVAQRRALAPVFRPDNVRGMIPHLQSTIDADLASWPIGQPFDVEERMLRLSLTMAVRTLFADDGPGADPIGEAGHHVEWLMEHFYRRSRSVWRFPYHIPGFNRRYHAHAARLTRFVTGLNPAERSYETVPSHLAEAAPLRLQQATTLIIAGYETTGHALAWAFHLLARHPQIEEAVLRESRSTSEHRPWTEAVIQESLRLYPPVWLLSRRTQQPLSLGDDQLPESSIVLISPWLLHRRPDLFEDPEAFRPERWFTPAAVPSPYAFIPFGAGARRCIGELLARQEALQVITRVVARYRLTTTSDPGIFPGLTLRARGPLWVTAHQRSS